MPDDQGADDIQLLKRIQDGDHEAFGGLYERYSPVIFRFLYAQLNERMDAEDLTVDVFVKAWRSLPKYNEQGVPFAAYLFRIARNALVDHYRRNKRARDSLSLEESLVGDRQPGPGDVAIANLEKQEIRLKLGQLREEYRMVLLLRFMGDLSPEETAEVMGKSSGAIRVLQHRALGALRQLLEQ